ncbi:acyltransferase family protein [Blastococcus sp. VKM Ac-2987]|uniref:acyltransferase family protein n=1 Tax=Blastococcus sp. VKM Ac-2987 TaxID=3004141 RepID=UPI0022ABBCE4|nr:acyltransferase [Blastococcus sp. VKM Ac-2987]MCZ2860379.1 acyltransferase [Blastococcus sp. VKM Ac-2987]
MTASAALEGGPEARVERAFPCLDGMRAIAAGAVVLTHAGFWTGGYTPDLTGHLLNRLGVGVAIFFVLSGFLLSRPVFLAAVERRRAPGAAAYLWRRALRILPAYWLAVAAALLLLPTNRGADARTWVEHLTLVQLYTGRFGDGLNHTWSLCTEVAFYACLPLLAGGLVRLAARDRWRPARVLAALAALTALSLLAVAWSSVLVGGTAELWLPAHLGWFAAGMALAVLSVSPADWRPVQVATALGADVWTCWAGAGVLFLVAANPLTGPVLVLPSTPAEAVLRNVLFLGVGTLLVWPLVLGDQGAGRTRRLLAGRPVTYLGEISYGVFLFHLPVLAGAYALFGWQQFTGSLVLVFLATWLGGALVAAVVYQLVERPLRRWRFLVPDRPVTDRDLPSGSTGSSAATTAARATAADA